MPLLNGSSDEVLRENVRELRRMGHPEAQAYAIALQKQRDATAEEEGSGPPDESPLAKAARAARAGREQAPGHEGTETAGDEATEDALEQTRFHRQGASDSVREAAAKGAPPRKPVPPAKKPTSDEIPMAKGRMKKPSSSGGRVR